MTMNSLEKTVVARLSVSGIRFEVIVNPDAAFSFRSGKDVEFLAVPEVFRDAGSGLRASREELLKAFGTEDPVEIAKKIVREGDIQVTAEQRRRLVEEKKRRIASIISRESVNPQTGTPHPVERILNAMDQAKVRVDPFKTAEQQVEEVLDRVRRIIPVKIEKAEIEITVHVRIGPRVSGLVRKLGTVKSEEWGEHYRCVLEVPAGLKDEVVTRIGSATGGSAEIKIRG